MSNYKAQIEQLRALTKNMHVLFVEDHKLLHATMLQMLQSLFAHVDHAYDGQEALEIYTQSLNSGNDYHFIFSDIEMPHLNGVELSKKIKLLKPQQQVIIFSAHQDSNYLLELINLGIRRFIPKPVSLEILLQELQIICNEISTTSLPTSKIQLATDIFYNQGERKLLKSEETIPLTPYEILILEFLLENRNTTVSTQELLEHLYIQTYDVKQENVRKIIYKLRKKLPKEMIQNIHSIGYILKISV